VIFNLLLTQSTFNQVLTLSKVRSGQFKKLCYSSSRQTLEGPIMAYRDNVSALAELRGISNNPGLREEDIGIGGLHFFDDRGGRTRVISTSMNRASRLFFQQYREKSESPERWVISGKEFQGHSQPLTARV
jgi:hypothetical protein